MIKKEKLSVKHERGATTNSSAESDENVHLSSFKQNFTFRLNLINKKV